MKYFILMKHRPVLNKLVLYDYYSLTSNKNLLQKTIEDQLRHKAVKNYIMWVLFKDVQSGLQKSAQQFK